MLQGDTRRLGAWNEMRRMNEAPVSNRSQSIQRLGLLFAHRVTRLKFIAEIVLPPVFRRFVTGVGSSHCVRLRGAGLRRGEMRFDVYIMSGSSE